MPTALQYLISAWGHGLARSPRLSVDATLFKEVRVDKLDSERQLWGASSGNAYTGEVNTKTKTTDLNHVDRRQAQRGNEIITTLKEAVRKTLDK